MVKYNLKAVMAAYELEKGRISYVDIAKKTGLSVQTLTAIANQRTNPTCETIGKIISVLGCSFDDILFLADEEQDERDNTARETAQAA